MPDQTDQLRNRIAVELMAWAGSNNNPAHEPFRRPTTVTANAYSRADAVLSVVQPELDRLQGALAAILALLPADPAEDINAAWIPARLVRAAANGRPAHTAQES
jgi:hypothetical protein